MTTGVRVERAKTGDIGSLLALLTAARLPIDGFAEHLSTALVARDAGRSIGCAALEPYGTNALLRSLTVAESHRGRGIGQQLTEAALELAREHRIQKLYLLTTTAADFFATRFDFHPIARADVPAAVRESVEFVSACPGSAQVMFRRTD